MSATATQTSPGHRVERPEDRDLSRGLKFSIAAHVALFVAITAGQFVAPRRVVPHIPTLRVDLVALPDQLKKDKVIVAPPPTDPADVAKQLKQAEAEAKRIKEVKPPPAKPTEVARPDEMVIKPTQAPDKGKKNAKDREKKLKSALDRIKALAKVQEDTEPAPTQVLKGNKISKGQSVSDDAREGDDEGYLDLLRQHLQNHWELPVFLARQNFSAQVQLFIDARGKLQGFKFVKPSGNPQFDNEVKKTLTASQPYPKPPKDGELATSGVLVGFPL